jgi:hypothetical protein
VAFLVVEQVAFLLKGLETLLVGDLQVGFDALVVKILSARFVVCYVFDQVSSVFALNCMFVLRFFVFCQIGKSIAVLLGKKSFVDLSRLVYGVLFGY